METVQKANMTLQVENTKHWDDTFRLISGWDSDKISSSKVMVVGAGALGNEVLKNLALLNVGHILIVDFDTIEYTNLCRSVLFRESDLGEKKCEIAAQSVRSINPNVKTQAINGDITIDIGLGVFRRMDVVIGCLDNRLARLFINRYCFKTNKTWVDGAIENFAGQLDVFKPGVSCYECQLSDLDWKVIRYRLGCPDIAQRNAADGKIATTPISSSIIGAMQVQEALKIIYRNHRQSMAGQHFKYEGMNNMMLQYPSATEVNELCESHYAIEKLTEAHSLSADNTVGELLEWAAAHFDDEDATLHLGYEVVQEITTRESGIIYPVLIAKPHFSDNMAHSFRKVPGEDLIITQSIGHGINKKNFSQLAIPLRQIGVPPLHILTIEANGAYHFVELTGDEHFLNFQ